MDFESELSFGDNLKNLLRSGQDREDTLVIGLDLGTKYSNVAYGFTTIPGQIYMVNTWPGAPGVYAKGSPDVVQYDTGAPFRWGYQVKRLEPPIRGIGSILDPRLDLVPTDAKAKLGKLGKSAHEIVTDYLCAIYRYTIQYICNMHPGMSLDLLKRQHMLSVPAVYYEEAKSGVLQAARDAGIFPSKLITASEAAALSVLHDIGGKGFEVGDNLIICNAGEAEFHVASFEIANLEHLEFRESTFGAGTRIGSLKLNERFEEWVKDIVGEEPFIELRKKQGYHLAMKQFEDHIKPGFRSRHDKERYINFSRAKLKDDASKGLESDTITVTSQTLLDIFDPVVQKVDELVTDIIERVQLKQVGAKRPKGSGIKAITLTGSWSTSEHLCEYISYSHKPIQVIQATGGWSAAARGAVMSGYPSQSVLITRMLGEWQAKRHYGVIVPSIYHPIQDAGQETYHDKYGDGPRCRRVNWLIEKGEDVQRTDTFELPYSRMFEAKPTYASLQVVHELLACGLDEPPCHPNKASIEEICTLTSDLSIVPVDMFQRRTGRGSYGAEVDVWELHYRLRIKFQHGALVFTLVCGKVEYGHTEVSF